MALQRGRLTEGRLEFDDPDGLVRALRDGCFRLRIPDGLDVEPGIRLCREFYRPAGGAAEDDAYRGFRGTDGIYFDREHFQTEHLLTDAESRARVFPPDVVAMCDRMHDLGLGVLAAAMTQLGVPRDLWHEVTGGAADGRGTHWFAASHYRPERDGLGCAEHKDTGFVTVLYIDQEGLEAYVDGAWVSIDPEPGHFVVNFGGAFELLTAPLRLPVQAILHRVRRCVATPGREDRFSFAAFVNPPATGDLYQMHDDGSARAVQSVEEFLREFNKTTWNDRHEDFGITAPAVVGATGGTR